MLVTPGRLCMITEQADFIMYSNTICLYTVDPKFGAVQTRGAILHEVRLHADNVCISIRLIWINTKVLLFRTTAFYPPLQQHKCLTQLVFAKICHEVLQ